MPTPIIHAITPSVGPTSGGDLARLVGLHFAPQVTVRFGEREAEVLAIWSEELDGQTQWVIDVRTPAHPAGLVTVSVENLDDAATPVPDELGPLADAYLFERSSLIEEASVTRLIRALLQELKVQVIENTNMTVALDYDATLDDASAVPSLAELPALILSGPTVRLNRFYANNVPHERVILGSSGPELLRYRPALTADLSFRLTGASTFTAELLNLMGSLSSFLNRNHWISLARDPDQPELGSVRWELDMEGELRTNLYGRDDLRVFTCGLVVRGFDLDEGLPMDWGKAVTEAPELQTLSYGSAP